MRRPHDHPRPITLRDYVRRRNGVPLGASGALPNMLRRSFGAGSFAGFWRYWNPIFGYYLGTYIFRPTSTVAPRAIAVIVTFLACGALHDLVTVLARGSTQFLFTYWFFLMALGLLIGEAVQLKFARYSIGVRAAINLGYLLICLVGAVMLQRLV